MYRSKDFLFMDIIDIRGRKQGSIKDILVNFYKGSVTGFSISSTKAYKKCLTVQKEDIIAFNSNMIVKNIIEDNALELSRVKGMDVIDIKGNIIGVVEDVLFSNCDFSINGVIVSTGFIRNLIYGKKVFLIKDLIFGDKNILYFKENTNMNFATIPHELLEVDKYE